MLFWSNIISVAYSKLSEVAPKPYVEIKSSLILMSEPVQPPNFFMIFFVLIADCKLRDN